MFFECNLPKTAPSFLSADFQVKYQTNVDRIYARMEKLEEALDMTGLDGETFSELAKKFWDYEDQDRIKQFDRMSAEELCTCVMALHDGQFKVAPRVDWPSAEVLFDAAFVATKEWESLRHLGVGGSDTSVIKNVNAYRTLRGLYFDKIGSPELTPNEDRQAIFARGHFMEDKVIQAFCKATGARYIPETRMFRSKKYPAATANIDAIVEMANGDLYVFEAKSANIQKFSHWMGGRIPPEYQYQMRQYPAVLDDDRIKGTYIGCLFVQDISIADVYVGSSVAYDDFVSHFLERDKEEEEDLLKREQDFWDTYVETETPPPESGNSDLDKQTAAKFEIGEGDSKAPLKVFKYSSVKDTVDDIFALREERKKYETLVKDLKEEEDGLALELMKEMGSSEDGYISIDADSYIKVRYAASSLTKIDTDLMKLQFPDAYNACVSKQKGNRSFRLTKGSKSGSSWSTFSKKFHIS